MFGHLLVGVAAEFGTERTREKETEDSGPHRQELCLSRRPAVKHSTTVLREPRSSVCMYDKYFRLILVLDS